ncbi:helix-turn-helix domain-containing protein [Clostridium sp.]|uniref:helix-turn-helix domain-containing protein n=1 Tax=Clostridium sp. TaxID=1506 RepID=UPI00307C3A32
MKYINAKNLLPDALVKELQSYIQGGYDAYINKLGLRTIVDESGQPHKQVDPYMKGRLQSKLMQAITKK